MDAIPPYTCMEDTVCALQLTQLASTQSDKTGGKGPTRKGGRPATLSGRPTTQSGFLGKKWLARGNGGLHIESKPMVGWGARKCGPKTKKTNFPTRKSAGGEKSGLQGKKLVFHPCTTYKQGKKGSCQERTNTDAKREFGRQSA